jgi:putative flippase GtrA
LNQFLRFCMVGVVGFVIDAGILQALVVGAHANPYAARIASFLAAASGTWLMNRHYVFAVRRKPTHAEWLRYVGLMVLGALVNYGAYALCIAFWVFARAQPWLGVAVGSVAGLGVNFTTARLLFRQSKGCDGRGLPT